MLDSEHIALRLNALLATESAGISQLFHYRVAVEGFPNLPAESNGNMMLGFLDVLNDILKEGGQPPLSMQVAALPFGRVMSFEEQP